MRFDLRRCVWVVPVAVHRRNGMRLLSRDISSSGAFLYADRCLLEGTAVLLFLTLSLGDMEREAFLEVNGQVIRTERQGMAISFCQVRAAGSVAAQQAGDCALKDGGTG